MHASRLYLLLFSLYWAQGLPIGFMTHALPVILRAQGVSLAQIGGFGLLMLPWSNQKKLQKSVCFKMHLTILPM
jgi:hypothetical protein